MIIKIHESVFLNEIQEDKKIRWLAFINTLVTSVSCGHHLFTLNPQLKSEISKSSDINEYQKYILNTLIKKNTFHYETLKNSHSIELSMEQGKSTNIIEIENHEIQRILHPTEIIIEDIGDNLLYDYILRKYKIHKKINQPTHYRPIHGGGDPCHHLVPIHFQYNNNVFSIFDSDKKHPDDRCGDTANQLIDAFNALGINNNYYLLKCSEVENLHPLQSYQNKSRDEQKITVSFLEHAIKTREDAYFYFDFKKSHKYRDVFSQKCQFSNYWRNIYETCDRKLIDLESLVSDPSKHGNSLTPKLSTVTSLLKRDLQDENYSDVSLNDIQPISLRTIWNEIGELMLKWSFASPRIML